MKARSDRVRQITSNGPNATREGGNLNLISSVHLASTVREPSPQSSSTRPTRRRSPAMVHRSRRNSGRPSPQSRIHSTYVRFATARTHVAPSIPAATQRKYPAHGTAKLTAEMVTPMSDSTRSGHQIGQPRGPHTPEVNANTIEANLPWIMYR
jgi:hypothetical protein